MDISTGLRISDNNSGKYLECLFMRRLKICNSVMSRQRGTLRFNPLLLRKWPTLFTHQHCLLAKSRASGNQLYSAGSSASCSVMTQMSEREAGGRSPRGRGYMHTQSRFTSLYSRNQHTIKPLYSNTKILNCRKMIIYDLYQLLPGLFQNVQETWS